MEKYGKLSLNYPRYPFLSGVLVKRRIKANILIGNHASQQVGWLVVLGLAAL